MIIKYFAVLGILLSPFLLPAQNSELDSLIKVSATLPPDTNKVKALNEISWQMLYLSKYGQARTYANQALELSDRLNYLLGKIKSITRLGLADYDQGKFFEALGHYFKALQLSNEQNFILGKNIASNNIGNTYYQLGNYSQAIDYHLSALKAAEQMKDNEAIAISYNNIGNVHYSAHNYDKALEYYLKSQGLRSNIIENEELASMLSNIGQVYHHKGEFEKALDYSNRALKIREKINYLLGVAISYNINGLIYEEKKEYANAIESFTQSLSVARKIGSRQNEAMALCNRAQLYQLLKNNKLALKDVKESLEIDKQSGSVENMKTDYKLLAEICKNEGEFAAAADNYNYYIQLNDSLENEQKSNDIKQKEQQYEFEKEQEKRHIEEEKQRTIAHEKLKQQRIIIVSLFGGSILLTLLGFVTYRAYLIKRKDNTLLALQKKEIEEKHHEITNSINYAKRIQQAILPPIPLIQKAFPESFILFKPKDIVSGDFYWFKETEKGYLIAAADCTGHGVPGAFMNMIGYEKLNEAAQQSDFPAKILSLLNKGIKTSLRQSEADQSSKDGMDIALCSIDFNNNTLHYAGANRPIWIIRKNDTDTDTDIADITEIKATKTAIGGLTDDNFIFNNHEIHLQKGDTIYIFSDGYADQFGGPQGKKLGTKKFKGMLAGIQDWPMKIQKQKLENFINNWKANEEQVDDVLIIGIRIN